MASTDRLPADETTMFGRTYLVDVEQTIKNLNEQEDTDGNFQITIEDNGPKVSDARRIHDGSFS
jgi:alpha,alpha-trehalase